MKNKIKRITHETVSANMVDYSQDNDAAFKVLEYLLDELKIDYFAGVQPMQGPVGLVYFLEHKKMSDTNDNITLEVVSKPIEAYIKHKIIIDLDAIDISVKYYGEEMRTQYYIAPVQELVLGMNNALIDVMYNHAQTYNFRIDSEKDTGEIIFFKLMEACNDIAIKTNRGIANNIILPEKIYAIIYPFLKQLNFKEYHESNRGLSFKGSTITDINIFTSSYSDVALVHYKGDNGLGGQIDTNIVYSPLTLLAHNKVCDDRNYLELSLRENLSIWSDTYTGVIQIR